MLLKEFVEQEGKKSAYTLKANERLISVAEYAEQNEMTPQGVRARLKKGQIDGIQIGSHWYVRIIDTQSTDIIEENRRLNIENATLKAKINTILSLLQQ